MKRSTHLGELALAGVVQAGSVGNPVQVVQGVHAGGEIAIAKRLHRWLLDWSGKIYVFRDAGNGNDHISHETFDWAGESANNQLIMTSICTRIAWNHRLSGWKRPLMTPG